MTWTFNKAICAEQDAKLISTTLANRFEAIVVSDQQFERFCCLLDGKVRDERSRQEANGIRKLRQWLMAILDNGLDVAFVNRNRDQPCVLAGEFFQNECGFLTASYVTQDLRLRLIINDFLGIRDAFIAAEYQLACDVFQIAHQAGFDQRANGGPTSVLALFNRSQEEALSDRSFGLIQLRMQMMDQEYDVVCASKCDIHTT